MVYTLGESLLDVIFENGPKAVAKAGGGMLNTSVSLARRGVEVSLISELGDDKTAQIIIGFLNENKVYTKYIKKYYHQTSSVALAFLDERKTAAFSIYKTYPEKRNLVFPKNFSDKDILVFGSLYSLDPEIRQQLKLILASAKSAGTLICYDPNIRSHDPDDAEIRQALTENIAFSDIVKASDEDMKNIFGEMAYPKYYEEIKKINTETVFVLTLGSKGVVGFSENISVQFPAKEVKVVSTIGAGDSFNAGMVFYLKKSGFKKQGKLLFDKKQFKEMLLSGLRFSAEVCSTLENYVNTVPSTQFIG